MSYIVGALLGMAAGITCVVLVGGVMGIVAGLAVAALLYIGVGELLKPERRLGGMVARLIPDGEAAVERVDAGRALVRELTARRRVMRDEAVARELDDLIGDIEALIACVEAQPRTYRRLAHFLATYEEQTLKMLDGYLSVEALNTPVLLRQGREDALEALQALQGVAQGELARAGGAKAAELEVSSDAIQRLMEMDGYTPDENETADTRRVEPRMSEGAPGGEGKPGIETTRRPNAWMPSSGVKSVRIVEPTQPRRGTERRHA